uniref:hypothetical protein n=1 Tax=Enterobacter hormaechei TaxID=158836 RepID=UPI00195430A2
VHDDAAYVPKKLVAEWKARDPITLLRDRLLLAHVDQPSLCDIDEANKRLVEDAVTAAEAAPMPDPAGMEHE